MGKMVDSTSRSLVPVLHGTTAQNREFISSVRRNALYSYHFPSSQ